MYEKPVLTKLGTFRELTQQGSPNEAYDGGSWWDFMGPSSGSR
jgi:hypothetical protein